MSQDSESIQTAIADERLRPISPIRKALVRPELGAICGTVLVFLFFLLAMAGSVGMSLAQDIVSFYLLFALTFFLGVVMAFATGPPLAKVAELILGG
jgi:simple sugar transport system permease protein